MDAIVATSKAVKLGLRERMAGYQSILATLDGTEFQLFKSNVAPTVLTTLADLVEADFSGYAPLNVGAFPYDTWFDNQNRAYADSGLLTWTHSGGVVGNTIYLAGLCGWSPGGNYFGDIATATATVTAGAISGITVDAPGIGYQVAPRVAITGSSTTQATAHAVISAGLVTSIVIDNPGAGYTTAAVVIEAPRRLLDIYVFDTPAALTAIGDALNMVFEWTEDPTF